MATKTPEQINEDLLRPLSVVTPKYFIMLGFLLAVVIVAGAAFGRQMYAGLGITGLNRPVYWAFY
ncbi:MAG: polysulfide reductase, partial [Acidobacteriota bacterium]|nr:polysulfide reductase [Acidobacteriota bacterium]